MSQSTGNETDVWGFRWYRKKRDVKQELLEYLSWREDTGRSTFRWKDVNPLQALSTSVGRLFVRRREGS